MAYVYEAKRKQNLTGVCPCGAPAKRFSVGTLSKYCGSTICRQKYARKPYKDTPAAKRRRPKKVTFLCLVCGEQATMTNTSRNRYCSRSCRRKAEHRTEITQKRHRDRLRAKQIAATMKEKINPYEVFDRDGWRCQLCGKVISKTERFPSDWSASLDHIVPVSSDGGHTLDNLQAAHLGCNRRRSNRGKAQMRLF